MPVLPDCRPDRAEPAPGGAGNGCYGKCAAHAQEVSGRSPDQGVLWWPPCVAVLQNISCPRPGIRFPEQPASGTGRDNHVPDGALRKKSRHGHGGILANGRTGDGNLLQESGAKHRGMAWFWPESRKPQRDRMCNCNTAHTRPHNYPGQGVAPTPKGEVYFIPRKGDRGCGQRGGKSPGEASRHGFIKLLTS